MIACVKVLSDNFATDMSRWLICFIFFVRVGFCQQILEGRVLDKTTHLPVPFASIGIVGSSSGTSANLEGEFSLFVKGVVIIKITCIGYESLELKSTDDLHIVYLSPSATQLNEVIILSKSVNPRKIVRRVFANISQNYLNQPFQEKLFYRHYCKDDSAYGRLIEAHVEVWKPKGYYTSKKGNESEALRVRHLRRSIDRTTMSQGHEPIAINYALQADVIGYQSATASDYFSFYSNTSSLLADFEKLDFKFGGITYYDGMEVYEISYENKRDSLPTTSGKYLSLARIHGVLYVSTSTFVLVKSEEVKEFGDNSVHSSCLYRRYNDRYYPYHFIRDGRSRSSDGHTHTFHVEMMATELETDAKAFRGMEPTREDLLKIPYDSAFWSNNSMLKTTPLEQQIIKDLGHGVSLEKQFAIYRDFEINTTNGGQDGARKFQWLLNDSKGVRNLYVLFWSGDCRKYLVDMEYAKRMNKIYRKEISFVFVSLDDEEDDWKKKVNAFNFFSDGIINYRIGSKSDIKDLFSVKDIPAFFIIPRTEAHIEPARHPSDTELEKDFYRLIHQSN